MISFDKEFYSSPYYFSLKKEDNNYTLCISLEKNLSEEKKNKHKVRFGKKDLNKVKNYIEKLTKNKKVKNTSIIKKDLEELVDSDGVMRTSSVPSVLDPRLHPKKTMDQTIAAASITNDPISRGYRTYYGESVEKEISEVDYSNVFGWEETKDMDGPKTYEYMVKKLNLPPDEAAQRTKEQGKNPFKKKKKMTISEIQKQKMIKVLEDIITNKNKGNSDVINKKNDDEELPPLLKRNLKSLLRYCDNHNISKNELIKIIKGE
jgi:hypothetical protein